MNSVFSTQYGLPLADGDECINVDLFAGGGGASTGIEMGLGRPVHLAINHSPAAISMHEANHPGCMHLQTDVWEVDPILALAGRRIGWFHASPDCTHHSQAAGGQPRKKEIRNLSWVVPKWAGTTKPKVISMENVRQIRSWGPLVAKRCKKTGRVMRLDGSVAGKGEHTPRDQQFLVPDKKRSGQTWQQFIRTLESMGYAVEHRLLRACDYGAPTSRERLFLIARCDGRPIIWPEPTHAERPRKGQKPYRTAAECIDWSIEGHSIFDRPRPLADATLRRIARGIRREVVERQQPFIVPIANWSREAVHPTDLPLNTITAWPKGGSFSLGTAVIAPAENLLAAGTLVQVGYGEREGQAPRVPGIGKPLGTIVGTTKHAAVTAFMAQMNGGFNVTHSKPADSPMTTVTATGSQQQLVTASLLHMRGNCDARAVDEPLRTISAGGTHHGVTTACLIRQFGCSTGQAIDKPAPTITAGGGGKTALAEVELLQEVTRQALRCAAFLVNYYGNGDARALENPMDTITTRDRLALVTVQIAGQPWVIVDIKLRMLQPHELYAAQGFPSNYIIDRGHDGRRFTKTEQVRMVGNSVSPAPMAAIAAANNPYTGQAQLKAA